MNMSFLAGTKGGHRYPKYFTHCGLDPKEISRIAKIPGAEL
jgi:hypothetical protein